jgi:kynureninase
MAAHLASLHIFNEAGMDRIGEKRDQLTAYLEFLLEEYSSNNGDILEIITPKNSHERGSQLSILFKEKGKEMYDLLSEAGIIADWREPNVIRVSPVPLYVSFEDCWHFVDVLRSHNRA